MELIQWIGILAAIWIAPHTNKIVSMSIGMIYVVVQIVLLWQR